MKTFLDHLKESQWEIIKEYSNSSALRLGPFELELKYPHEIFGMSYKEKQEDYTLYVFKKQWQVIRRTNGFFIDKNTKSKELIAQWDGSLGKNQYENLKNFENDQSFIDHAEKLLGCLNQQKNHNFDFDLITMFPEIVNKIFSDKDYASLFFYIFSKPRFYLEQDIYVFKTCYEIFPETNFSSSHEMMNLLAELEQIKSNARDNFSLHKKFFRKLPLFKEIIEHIDMNNNPN